MEKSQYSDEMYLQAIALSLRAQRTRLRQSIKELARLLDVSEGTVKAMEAGSSGVSIQTWLRAWQLYQVMPGVAQAAAESRLGSVVAVKQIEKELSATPAIRRERPIQSQPQIVLNEVTGAIII